MGIYARAIYWLIEPALKLADSPLAGVKIDDMAAVASPGDTVILNSSKPLKHEQFKACKEALDALGRRSSITFVLLGDPLRVDRLQKFDGEGGGNTDSGN